MIRTSHITKTMAALGAVMAVGASPALANSNVSVYNGGAPMNAPTADYSANNAIIMSTELGKDNNIRVQRNQYGDIWFRDTLQPIDAGDGCTQISAKIVSCEPGDAEQIRVHSFDGKNNITVDDDVTLDTNLNGGDTKKQTIDGGGGRDLIRGGDGSDALTGGPGDDVIEGWKGNDNMEAGGYNGQGRDTYRGGEGIDQVTYAGTLTGVDVSIDDDVDDGAPGEKDNVTKDVENVWGTSYGDKLRGSSGPNTMHGEGGVDYMYGNEGDDKLNGGAEGDFLYGGADDDGLYGIGGNDQLKGEGGEDKLYGHAGLDKLDGGKDADFLFGMEDADALYGGGGSFDDQLDGGTGPDELDGGPGEGDSVSYAGRSKAVTADLTGSPGNDGETGEGDTIVGTVERLFGGTGDDTLTGNGQLNVITGNKGDDTIDVRGAGDDEAFGDEGNDTLLSRDEILDKDSCGAGTDKVTADTLDGVSADCETVDRGVNGGGNGGNGGNGGKKAGPLVKFAKAATVKKGKTKVKVVCPKTAKGACSGMLTLKAKGKTIGKAQFTIAPGKKANVTVKVSKKLKKGKSLKAVAYALVTDDVSASSTSKAKVKLKFKG